MAVAFHPEFEYVRGGRRERRGLYSGKPPALSRPCGNRAGCRPTFSPAFPEENSNALKCSIPFWSASFLGVLASYVTAEDGTGCVHTAPGHGREDFVTGQKYGLEVYCPVGEAGEFTEGLPEYQGKKVFDANEPIIELLKSHGTLAGEPGWLTHSYPHCWRCHNPIIFRANEQWFIDIDHDDLRQRALEEIKKVQWLPEWGEERISNMIATRPDWCISRQRIWGVPITVFHCEACQKPLMDAKLAAAAD